MRPVATTSWAVVLALVGVMAACPAHAEIKILKANGQPVPEGAAALTFNFESGGWDVELLQLYAPNSDTVYEIRANAGETIDNIFINVNGPAAGSPLIVRAYGDAPGYLRAVNNVIQLGNAETILNKVQVLDDIGSVQVEAIGDLLAGRDIIGPVIATTADNSIRGITNARAGRHIIGDLTAEHGRILVIYAQTGDIGTPSKPVSIRAKYHVYHVEGINVYADINTRVNGGTGGLFALISQQFHGNVECEKLILNPWLNMEGFVLISQQFSGEIRLGKSFATPSQYIQLPVTGLAGQIIFNADNAVNGSWTSPVRLGPNGNPNQIVLNSPTYAYGPTVLGGGSVGLVPFRLHSQACVPANGSNVQVSPSSPSMTVQLRHYGPVTWTGGIPLTIERRAAGSAQPFVNVPLTDFAAARSANNANVMNISAAPGRPGFAPGYEYRIRPTSQLLCEVPVAPPVQWNNDYMITIVIPPCDGDINGDGVVNVNDMLMIIAFWGPASPAFPAADVDHNGAVNVSDLLAVIANWGACW
jgi:hypothetical protein